MTWASLDLLAQATYNQIWGKGVGVHGTELTPRVFQYKRSSNETILRWQQAWGKGKEQMLGPGPSKSSNPPVHVDIFCYKCFFFYSHSPEFAIGQIEHAVCRGSVKDFSYLIA